MRRRSGNLTAADRPSAGTSRRYAPPDSGTRRSASKKRPRLQREMLAGSSAASGTRVEGVPAAGVLERGRAWTGYGYRLGVAAVTGALGAFLLWHLHALPPHEDEALLFFV